MEVFVIRFERVKEIEKDDIVHKLIKDFLKTNYDRVEVINEDDYKTTNAMIAALRWVIKNNYADKVKASKQKDRVYLSKLDHEYKTK